MLQTIIASIGILVLAPLFAIPVLIYQLLISLIFVFPLYWMYEYIQPTLSSPVLTVWHVFCIYNIVRLLFPIEARTKVDAK